MAENQARKGEQETGPYAEAHPERPNSGEAPPAEVTEEMLEAAEAKQGYGARGAVARGPVTDVDIGDTARLREGDQLSQLDEEIENETDQVKRAVKSAERDVLANRVMKREADLAAAEARESGDDTGVDDPGDARGQRTPEAREGGGGRRLSQVPEESQGEFNDVDADSGVEGKAKAKGKSKAQSKDT